MILYKKHYFSAIVGWVSR